MSGTVHQKFSAALDDLVAQIKEDRSILAAILCGSLSHDTVWAKSDIDLVLVTIDDKKVRAVRHRAVRRRRQRARVPACRAPSSARRSKARRATRSCTRFLAKGRLLYTHDPTIADLCATPARHRRARHAAAAAARGDARAAGASTRRTSGSSRAAISTTPRCGSSTPPRRSRSIEVIGARPARRPRGDPAGADAQPGVLQDRLHRPAERQEDDGAACRRRSTPSIATSPSVRRRSFAPVIDHLREAGEARSCSEIEAHFKRTSTSSGVTTACEYLADQGLIGKASTPVRLTKRSNVDVQELAFFYLGSTMPTWPRRLESAHKARAHDHRRAGRARSQPEEHLASRSRATASSSSPASRDRASRASRSTRSTPKASGATWSRCRATPSASSRRWPSRTSISCSACRRSSRSSRRR